MNDLYGNEYCLLQNFFCPAMKLVSKERINSKYRKKYDIPKTPYHRLLESSAITNKAKQTLTKIYKRLNPFALKKIIERKLNIIFQHI